MGWTLQGPQGDSTSVEALRRPYRRLEASFGRMVASSDYKFVSRQCRRVQKNSKDQQPFCVLMHFYKTAMSNSSCIKGSFITEWHCGLIIVI